MHAKVSVFKVVVKKFYAYFGVCQKFDNFS